MHKNIHKLLSDREKQIASLKMKGFTDRAISEELEIGECTVRYHVNNIYRKLKVPNAITLGFVYSNQLHFPYIKRLP